MPVYCYSDASGRTLERQFRIGSAPRSITDAGVRFDRDIAAEHRGFRNVPGTWPMKSDAAGCHPSQAQEYHEDSVRRGVPTDFDPKTGQAIFTSAAHRRRYCEARGIYDRNAGFRDPVPKGIAPPNAQYLAL